MMRTDVPPSSIAELARNAEYSGWDDFFPRVSRRKE